MNINKLYFFCLKCIGPYNAKKQWTLDAYLVHGEKKKVDCHLATCFLLGTFHSI